MLQEVVSHLSEKWPDYVIAAAQVNFAYSLYPEIKRAYDLGRQEILEGTSRMNMWGCYAMSVALYAGDMNFGSAMCAIIGTMWGVILEQKKHYDKVNHRRLLEELAKGNADDLGD